MTKETLPSTTSLFDTYLKHIKCALPHGKEIHMPLIAKKNHVMQNVFMILYLYFIYFEIRITKYISFVMYYDPQISMSPMEHGATAAAGCARVKGRTKLKLNKI